MLCPLTGRPHRLFWMRSAWWCHDCRQKIESCCDGAGCASEAVRSGFASDGSGGVSKVDKLTFGN
jgi:hypothetical protein